MSFPPSNGPILEAKNRDSGGRFVKGHISPRKGKREALKYYPELKKMVFDGLMLSLENLYSDLQELTPRERIQAQIQLLALMIPKAKMIELYAGVPDTVELAQMTDEELNQEIKRLESQINK